MHPRAAAAYQQLAVVTAPPAQLIVMLYRRVIQSVRQAVEALERKDLASAHNELVRAQGILFELQSSLNRDADPLAADLEALYQYFRGRLLDANLRKIPGPAEEVAERIGSLLQAWEAGGTTKS